MNYDDLWPQEKDEDFDGRIFAEIRGPKGVLRLVKIHPYKLRGMCISDNYELQSQAVKAFMEFNNAN